ncbi:peptide methionine sulfoxide reductase MsrA [Vitreoscilla sp. C1]|uniref:peptide-methionine (S)-S-oxide reductase MsrA n=1 Tax=Vitreoscilla sp. (strain C1) TaxID=96942 RepID=UPI000CDCD125|nr:peptide-methionine (S)-S-oxide reductase MsrA [Vitreoscilla sp. C1]AUZ04579.1 peptide methionine sulfoxide reductase MsrA [Vitreoscilla sp. C1]
MQTAILAGGCFWCLEAVFSQLQGVLNVKSGYINGHTRHPTYREVCTGNTGHAEAVKIDFDENIIRYDEVLDVFFTIHDPTTLNRQGHDAGTQYRSGIYYLNEEQKQQAQNNLAALQYDIPEPIVTEIVAAQTFYPAENEHDDYFFENPYQGYCQVVIAPKVQQAKQQFAHLWRTA